MLQVREHGTGKVPRRVDADTLAGIDVAAASAAIRATDLPHYFAEALEQAT